MGIVALALPDPSGSGPIGEPSGTPAFSRFDAATAADWGTLRRADTADRLGPAQPADTVGTADRLAVANTAGPAVVGDIPASAPRPIKDTAVAVAKVDRLPVRAVRPARPSHPARPVDPGVTITTSVPDAATTLAMPVLAYASLGGEPASPFDRLIVPGRTDLRPPRPVVPVEPPAVDEEDDADVQALPVPRRKPKLAAVEPLPMPHAKPAGHGDQPLPGPRAAPPAEAAAAPAPKPANTLLALLSPSTAPAPKPEATPPVVTRTPFGVPYVLQTEAVETACLRPELIDILRQVESHYGKKVVITSGYRDRGRPGSLHMRCAAADILVPGVSAQQLTAYVRTIPGVGGVGQYCHQSLVHVDVGTPRDWKYGCGSYFAMRDGSAGWGRKPAAD